MKWRSLQESGSYSDTRPLRQIFAGRKETIAQYVPADVQAIHDRTVAALKAQGLAAKRSESTGRLLHSNSRIRTASVSPLPNC